MLMRSDADLSTVTHGHLFCGSGFGAAGMQQANARVGLLNARMECVGGIDVDPVACRDFERLMGIPATCLDLFDEGQFRDWHAGCVGRTGKKRCRACLNTGEPPKGWRAATGADVRAAFGNRHPNIVFLSSPCLPASAEVLTSSGMRAISTIRANDLVMTHRGRYRPVREIGTHQHLGEMVQIRLNGEVDHQEFTPEHPMWVRRINRLNLERKRQLGEAKFLPAGEVRVNDRIGFPVPEEIIGTAANIVASVGDPQQVPKGGKVTGRYKKPSHIATIGRIHILPSDSRDLWFLLGVYVGDGYRMLRGTRRTAVMFCVGGVDSILAQKVRASLTSLGLHFQEDHTSGLTNIKIVVAARHLVLLAGLFGDSSDTKDLPPEMAHLERKFIEAFVDGYLASDGSEQGRRESKDGISNAKQARWRIVSVSLPLLKSFQRLLLRLGIYGFINKAWPGGEQIIMGGRKVQTRPRYEICVRLDPIKRSLYEFIEGAVWVRVRDVERRKADEPVWNMDVEEDDTYCTHMMATHNCKGLSGLQTPTRSASNAYQALNRLTVRGIRLMLEAFEDDPPELVIFENVPLIASRGRALLDDIRDLLFLHGYAVAETFHDCGELGGLAQHRRRFLLVARHRAKVPPYLYEPPKQRLKGVGEVIGLLPLPDAPGSGPMHHCPRLTWETWVRLALIPAGGDWRSLEGMDFTRIGIEPLPAGYGQGGVMGVTPWKNPSATVSTRGSPTNGAYSVQDPRPASVQAGAKRTNDVFRVVDWSDPSGAVTTGSGPSSGGQAVSDPRNGDHGSYQTYRVIRFDEPAPAVTSQSAPGGGGYTVADPRLATDHEGSKYSVTPYDEPAPTVIAANGTGNGATAVADPRIPAFHNLCRVETWEDPCHTVVGGTRPAGGALSVADPRPGWGGGSLGVQPWEDPSQAVTGEGYPTNGVFSVADPRVDAKARRSDFKTAGHYGVVAWEAPSGAVTANGQHDNSAASVADPRPLPGPLDRPDPVPVIFALDGTWHRPFTTLDLAALQFGVEMAVEFMARPMATPRPGKPSHTNWREHIGNAVPLASARAIGSEMARTILMARTGHTFRLSSAPIWVQPVAAAMSLDARPVSEITG